MKKLFLTLIAVSLMLLLTVAVAAAGDDPVPEVGYRVLDTSCGVPAGEWGFFTTDNWWWATYSNGRGILKCVTKLGPDQAPPDALVTIPVDACGTPAGSTDNAFTKVFPNGHVVLICRY